MRGIILTVDDCEPCDDLKAQFADLMESGEIIEKNAEQDTIEVAELMEKHDIKKIPSLLIVSDKGDLILSI